MKLIPLTNLLVAGVVTLGATASISQPSQAQSGRGFYCDTSRNNPVTVYQNHRGGTEPWIRWTSNYFRNAGYDPLTRCQDVSERLENYRRNRQLRFVTTGYMNRQKVICTASEFNGRCEGLILTLKPNEDPARAISNLFAWRSAGAPYASGRDRTPYIDVREHLGIGRE
ncbi:MAG: COP23 domain-containing protein [Rhizonema sp. NSF051]|nr:COP23 domain-containing protein [Rhizonema sp. NSF051]